MVKTEPTEVYRGKPVKGIYNRYAQEAEDEARSAKRSMWPMGDKYIIPREWRKMNKKQTMKGSNS